MRALGIALLGAAVTLVVIASPSFAASVGPSATWESGVSAVFTMTNSPVINEIVAYERSSTGSLTWVANFSTGGLGNGASLADQGSLAITANHEWLLAVDAGSNQVSVLRVGQTDGVPTLTLADVVESGGILPVSIAIHDAWVYVLNDGNSISPGNIAGFSLNSTGQLNPLAGSTQALSTSATTGAAQISFNPAGSLLVVTEKATSLIDVFAVDSHGVARAATVHASHGSTPYGFAFTPHGQLVVSEAASGSLSSYRVRDNGYFHVISGSITDFQTAPCWVVITPGGGYAYTTNAVSNTISSYTVGGGGRLHLLQAVAAATAAGPTDMALTGVGQFLYVRDSGSGQLEGFEVQPNGTLSWIETTGTLPSGDEGLVAI